MTAMPGRISLAGNSYPKLFLNAGTMFIDGGNIVKRGLVLIIIALSLSEILISAGADTEITNSSFDMKGTITNVLTPSSIVIGSFVVNLDGVDSSGLYRSTYYYLMGDLKSYYIGKDVLVKGNYVYFDLNGAYNSESINVMIQKDISDLQKGQHDGLVYGRHYGLTPGTYYKEY
jgi:hypothetical protein